MYLAVDDAEVAECMLAATRIGDDAENTYGELDEAVAAGWYAIVEALPDCNKINVLFLATSELSAYQWQT